MAAGWSCARRTESGEVNEAVLGEISPAGLQPRQGDQRSPEVSPIRLLSLACTYNSSHQLLMGSAHGELSPGLTIQHLVIFSWEVYP